MTEIINFIKYSFTDLPKLIGAKFLSWNKTVVYFFFLVFILATTITTDIWTFSDSLISDAQKISKQLPEFKVEDGELISDAEPTIFQTDHFIVTFDPQNQRSLTEFDSDASGQAIAVIFRKKELKLTFSTIGIASDRITFDYHSIGDFTNQTFKKTLNQLHKPIWLFFVTYLYSLLPAIQNLLFLVISVSLIIQILSFFSKQQTKRFSEIFKSVLVCSTAPIILTTLISFIFPTFDYFIIQSIMTYFLYFHVNNKKRKTST